MWDSETLRKPLLRRREGMPRSWLVCALSCLVLVSAALGDESAPASQASGKRSVPLPPRRVANEPAETLRGKTAPSPNHLWSTLVSLTLVVGAIVVVGRGLKRYGLRTTQSLPVEAFEVMGRRMLEPRVAVHMVRCGSRILLLGVGPEGARTLSEINDPDEVRKLTESCLGKPPEDTSFDSEKASLKGFSARSSTIAKRAMLLVAALGLFVCSRAEAQSPRPSGPNRRAQAQAPARLAVKDVDRPVEVVKSESVTPFQLDPQQWVSPQQIGLSLKMLALMTVFSLAPSILMMTTCYVRFTVSLGLLRQALGTQQGPPNQVLAAICLFLTFLVMSPVWQKCYEEGIRPYTNPATGETSIDETTALTRTIAPVRAFMSQQIERANNGDSVWMLLDYQRSATDDGQSWEEPQSYDDVPFSVLAPAYLLSELKVGFLIGFQLFLPFLVIDLVVAMVLTSLGLTMMPPSMVSLPFKLLLFVMIDGWFLTVGMLLESVGAA